MAFVVDNWVDLSATTGGNFSLTATGSNRVVYIHIYAEGAVTISSLTYGAQSPTEIADINLFGAGVCKLYRLAAPNTGAQTVTVAFSAEASRAEMYAVAHDDYGTERTASTTNGEVATSTLGVTSVSGDTVLDFAVAGTTAITADGSQTVREEHDDWGGVARSFGASQKTASGTTTNMVWTPGVTADVYHMGVAFAAAAAGGTVNTSTLSDTLTIADQSLDYVFATRLLGDTVTVSEGASELYTTSNLTAVSETEISDEFFLWLRRQRLLEDNILVTDQLISSVIGYLIYVSTLTSSVTVTDQALDTVYFTRLAESSLVTTDQLLRAVLVARDLLDGVTVTDSGLTAAQRFVLLTDTIALEDSLTALYLPDTGPVTDNPIIRIGFAQPVIDVGGYRLH